MLGAVLLSAVGAATFDDIYTLAHRSEIVTGTVVKKDASLRRPTDVTVRFITRAGQTVVADTSRIDHEPNVGDQIQIEYDPEEPSRMQGADWGHNYWLALSAFAPAALLLTVGVLDAFPRESPPPTDRKSARRPPTD